MLLPQGYHFSGRRLVEGARDRRFFAGLIQVLQRRMWGRFVVFLAGWSAVLGAGAGLAGAQAPGHVLAVVAARQADVPSTMTLVGSVVPYRRSVIASEVAGIVEELPVEEGDLLTADAVVCRLRTKTRTLLLAEAKARLGRLEEELAELKAGTRQEDLDAAKAAMEEVRALYSKWQTELERVTRLRDQGSAAQKEYNDTVAEAAASRQRLARMTAAYDLAVAGPRQEEIARARLAVEAQRLAVALLEYNLEQTTIRAPFMGYVISKQAELGEWVEMGGNVVELIDLERVLVRVDVPETAVSGAKVGASAAVTIDALHKTYRGLIKHVIPQADENARTFPVEVKLDNTSHELKSGMFARVRLPSGPTVSSTMIPRDAVLQRAGQTLVVMVMPAADGSGHQAMPVPVELGDDVGPWIAVTSPVLRAGMPVAVKGHDRIYGFQGPEPVARIVPGQVPEPVFDPVLTSPPVQAPGSQPASTATQPGA